MTDELTFPLEGESLRNWLGSAGQRIFTEFISGREALDWLRSQGGAIRTQDFYAIRREVLGRSVYDHLIDTLRENTLVPLGWTVYDHGWELSQNYLYMVDVTGTDPWTGDKVTKHFSVASDYQLTPGEIYANLGGMIEGEEAFYELVPEEYELTRALGMATEL